MNPILAEFKPPTFEKYERRGNRHGLIKSREWGKIFVIISDVRGRDAW